MKGFGVRNIVGIKEIYTDIGLALDEDDKFYQLTFNTGGILDFYLSDYLKIKNFIIYIYEYDDIRFSFANKFSFLTSTLSSTLSSKLIKYDIEI